MSINRNNPRRDTNEPEIKDELKHLDCKFIPLNAFDLLVKTPEHNVLMVEVKTATGRLTAKQRGYIDDGWPLYVVRSPAELRALVYAADNGEL